MKKHIQKIKDKINTIKLPKNLKFTKDLKTPLLTLAIGLLLGYLVTSSGFVPNPNSINTKKAKVLVEAYLKTLPLDAYTVNTIVPEGDLLKLSLTVNGKDYTSFMTKDGKFLFPESIDLSIDTTADTKTTDAGNAPQKTKDLPKSDKPVVELFIMSHCPYGTQMEKGILPVADALGDSIDFNIKFVSYAMHGEKEVKEQLTQYCIEKEMGKKVLNSYLKCFLGTTSGTAEEGATCMKSNNINTWSINACTTKVDSEFKIMANFNDKSTWNGSYPPFNIHKAENDKYGVQGSPTLVINGVEAQTSRDSVSLLTTICSAFNNQPESCKTQLDSASPTPGFGYGSTTTDSSAAQCN